MIENPLLRGLSLTREPGAFTLFIFGASGDLTARKLMPALYGLFRGGHIRDFEIVGFARRPWSDADFRRKVASMLESSSPAPISDPMAEEFLGRVRYISSPFEDAAGYRQIAEHVGSDKGRLYYLATPPGEYETIIRRLGAAGLADGNRFVRIVVEKPFGNDRGSARKLNECLAEAFREPQIYRIDHYLGKETVQNVMILRFGNAVFEPFWNSRYIDHVQITMAETLGVEGRGGYYEKAGALRDIVQNHLLQLLCLVAMEPPNDLHPDSIRNEKLKVLKSVKPIRPERVATDTVRGQYAKGIVEGKEVPAYRSEQGVSPSSETETFAAIRVYLESWRWAGVPFFLRTGKRLARRTTEIVVQFKHPPHIIFPSLVPGPSLANTLVLRIQPDEGIMLNFNAKVPGFSLGMRPVNMDFSYGSSFGGEPPEAYERLLLDAILGDATLYTRADEVEAAWAFVDGIREGWQQREIPIRFYPAGSSGPEESRALPGDGRRWRKL
ncbi:MAG: glucose-6-phosphate dehydrogenase [Spirochaetales bacterium]|nr:glucose-6-phosphate dehydrogenase [Spirochaetales bacterium]